MRLLVLIGLCMALGFALGVFYQESQGPEVAESEDMNPLDTQVGLGTDMSLLLSTSGILCEAVTERPRSAEIARIGNQAKKRQDSSHERLLTQLNLNDSQRQAVEGVVGELNSGLRSRASAMMGSKTEGNSITRIQAIDFVVGNLELIRVAEEGLRGQLSDEQLERLGPEIVNPFAYLDEEVVQLFYALSSTSSVP